MHTRCRYPTRLLRKIEKALKADDWKEVKQQSMILLGHLEDNGDMPRMESDQRRYILKGYLRHIIEISEG